MQNAKIPSLEEPELLKREKTWSKERNYNFSYKVSNVVQNVNPSILNYQVACVLENKYETTLFVSIPLLPWEKVAHSLKVVHSFRLRSHDWHILKTVKKGTDRHPVHTKTAQF